MNAFAKEKPCTHTIFPQTRLPGVGVKVAADRDIVASRLLKLVATSYSKLPHRVTSNSLLTTSHLPTTVLGWPCTVVFLFLAVFSLGFSLPLRNSSVLSPFSPGCLSRSIATFLVYSYMYHECSHGVMKHSCRDRPCHD